MDTYSYDVNVPIPEWTKTPWGIALSACILATLLILLCSACIFCCECCRPCRRACSGCRGSRICNSFYCCGVPCCRDEDAEYEMKLEKEQQRRRAKVVESKAKIDSIKAKYATGAARSDGSVVVNNGASAHRMGDMELTAFAGGRRPGGATDSHVGPSTTWTAVADPGQPDGPRRRNSTADAAAESAEQGVFAGMRDSLPLTGPYHPGTLTSATAHHGLPPALPVQTSSLRHEHSSDPAVPNGRSGSSSSRRLSRLGRRGTDMLDEHTHYPAGAPQGYQYPPTTTTAEYGQPTAPPAAPNHGYTYSQPMASGHAYGGGSRRGSAAVGVPLAGHTYTRSSAQV